MEIKEVLSYYVNYDNNILEVNFRTLNDTEDVLRNDVIDFSYVKEYGYELESNSIDFFGVNDEEDFDIDFVELDEDELISFLNEYYTVNTNLLPKAKFY